MTRFLELAPNVGIGHVVTVTREPSMEQFYGVLATLPFHSFRILQ